MTRELLHFAHSNGFPAGAYSKLFRALEPGFSVIHVDMFAHDPNFPVTDGWETQADQLIDFLERNASGPVLGVGHSFGASITFLAAVKRPELFRGIILIEPILFIGPMHFFVALAKKLGIIDRFTPAGRSKGRRDHWPDLDSARSYFKSRSLFRSFDPDCLEDYMEYGLKPCDNGYRLRFSVEKEVAIFRTGPHHLGRYNGRPKNMPGSVICAEDTDAMPIPMIRKFARLHDFSFRLEAGGHMFPLERPLDTAALITDLAAGFPERKA